MLSLSTPSAHAPLLSFSGGGLPFSGGCYKAKFSVPPLKAGEDFIQIRIPLSNFSDHWSSATGEQTKTCAADPSVCITAAKLAKIQRVELWAEGALGKVHLEVRSVAVASAQVGGECSFMYRYIPRESCSQFDSLPLTSLTISEHSPPVGATPDATAPGRPSAAYDTCKTAVQAPLKYGISGRGDAQGVPVAVDANETLAEAVCCDSRVLMYAEPQFLFAAPDIMLFSKMDAKGVTTFYDSACGVPVFKAPVGRTLAEFEADTKEHGWPSFRTGEVVLGNVQTDNATGHVTSTCGTHLGSYLPDSKGSRWCIDLSCISGSSALQ